MVNKNIYSQRCLSLAEDSVNSGGWPFSAIIVKNGEIITEAVNTVGHDKDPSAHAEINVIRKACKKLNSASLEECEMYLLAPPCPMCLSCMLMSGLDSYLYFLDIDSKDKCLTKLPLTKDLYNAVQNNNSLTNQKIDGVEDEVKNLFTNWNKNQ